MLLTITGTNAIEREEVTRTFTCFENGFRIHYIFNSSVNVEDAKLAVVMNPGEIIPIINIQLRNGERCAWRIDLGMSDCEPHIFDEVAKLITDYDDKFYKGWAPVCPQGGK